MRKMPTFMANITMQNIQPFTGTVQYVVSLKTVARPVD